LLSHIITLPETIGYSVTESINIQKIRLIGNTAIRTVRIIALLISLTLAACYCHPLSFGDYDIDFAEENGEPATQGHPGVDGGEERQDEPHLHRVEIVLEHVC